MTTNKHLKTLCTKSNEENAFLRRLLRQCSGPVGIFAPDHSLLLGTQPADNHEALILLDEEAVGYIQGRLGM